MAFSNDFLWGVSTSAAQIEGGAYQDGRTASIWDIFAQNGKTANAKSFSDACNSYNMFDRDLDNLIKLGVNSYRLSISCSRVLPQGTGALNQKGLDYYRTVFDKLLNAEIKPNVTLYHWDLPQALQEKGGWANRDCIFWFEEYAAKMFREFSRTVPLWSTVNEPIATYMGYAKGKFAPGIADEKTGNRARHNLLVAHGHAVDAFRKEADSSSQIGIVIDRWKRYPKTLNRKNLEAVKDEDERNRKFYTDPVLGKGYSDYILTKLKEENTLMEIAPDDYGYMQKPIDFFGLNIYNRVVISKSRKTDKKLFQDNNSGYYPKVVYDTVKMLREMYGLKIPVYITENGTPGYLFEPKGFNSMINDNRRIRYIDDCLSWIEKANEDNLDIRGYYAWSLMDNFEWCAGHRMKYGLIHTDFKIFKTEWKKSAYFYRDYIKSHKNQNGGNQ